MLIGSIISAVCFILIIGISLFSLLKVDKSPRMSYMEYQLAIIAACRKEMTSDEKLEHKFFSGMELMNYLEPDLHYTTKIVVFMGDINTIDEEYGSYLPFVVNVSGDIPIVESVNRD